MNRTKNGGNCKRSAKRSLCCRQWIGLWSGWFVVHIYHFAMGWVGVVDPRITLTCQVERRQAYSQRNSTACTAAPAFRERRSLSQICDLQKFWRGNAGSWTSFREARDCDGIVSLWGMLSIPVVWVLAGRRRVRLGMACFVFSSLSGHAPSYLSDDIHLVSKGPRRHLRSSTDRSCVVPRTYNTFGDRSFAVAGPRVWNSLPEHLRDEDITYSSFRCELKTYWFSCNRGTMWHPA